MMNYNISNFIKEYHFMPEKITLIIMSTFLFGIFFVKISQIIAIKFDIVDRPDSHIKSHKYVTPYLGGLGVILTFFLSFFIFNNYEIELKNTIELLSLFSIFLLGLVDDKYNLSIKTRLFIQSLIVVTLLSTGNIAHLSNIPAFDLAFTFIGIIFLINAMNILDILDGLMSGILIIILIGLITLNTVMASNDFYIFLSAILIVTLISFLVYNFNPSSIFLGDAGSTFSGLFLAIIFINTINSSTHVSFTFSAFIALSIPIFELFYVSILRIRKGISPLHGSKDHFAIRKIIMGHSVREVVLLTYLITLLTIMASYISIGQSLENLLIITTGILITFFIFGYSLSKIKIT